MVSFYLLANFQPDVLNPLALICRCSLYLKYLHSRGQLGRGLIVEEQSAAVIQALEGIKIQFIAAGGWHSAAISGKSGFH